MCVCTYVGLDNPKEFSFVADEETVEITIRRVIHCTHTHTYVHVHVWQAQQKQKIVDLTSNYYSLVLMQRHLWGVSLHELAAVVQLQCTAAVHRFLRGDGQLNTSAAMQSKARMHRIYGLPGLYTKRIMVYTYLAYVWFASKPPSVKKCLLQLLPSPHNTKCAGIRTTALACAHVSGASGGSDVLYIYT